MTNDYNQRNVDFNTIHATSPTHFDIFYKVLSSVPPTSLLDVGGGYGSLLFEYLKRFEGLSFEYNILEASQLQVEKGKKKLAEIQLANPSKINVNYLYSDFLSFKFGAKQFSHIVLKMVLHEFPKAQQQLVLKKIHSLLEEKGVVFVWMPFLNDFDCSFFNTVIKEKDLQAGFKNLSTQRYFCHKDEFSKMVSNAGFRKMALTFKFEYILDTQLRLVPEFNNNQKAYLKWLNNIEYAYRNLPKTSQDQIDFLSSPDRIFIKFFRGLYLLTK